MRNAHHLKSLFFGSVFTWLAMLQHDRMFCSKLLNVTHAHTPFLIISFTIPQGFEGYLQAATPDIFACSELHPPIQPADETSGRNRSLRGGGIRGHRQENEIAVMEAAARAAGVTAVASGGPLPTAVLVSRSLPSDPDSCTFEQKVGRCQKSLRYSSCTMFCSGNSPRT